MGAAEAPRLREAFAGRAISLGTMPAALRALTAVALAAVGAAAVLVGVRGAGLPTVPLGAEGGLQSAMPALTFWTTIVLLSLAWSYVLGGMAHAHPAARLAGPAAFGFGVYELLNLGLPVETWRIAPALAFAVAAAVVSVVAPRRMDERLRLAVIPLLFLLVLGFYLAFWWRLRPLGDERFYTLGIYHELAQLSFGLIPLLLVTGVDFAEWGHMAAERAAGLVGGLRPVGAAVAAAGVLAYAIGVRGTEGLPWHLGLAAIFLGLLALALGWTAPRTGGHSHVPYAAIFGSALALTGIVLGIVYAPSSAAPTAAGTQHTLRSSAPAFQVVYPDSWTEQALPEKHGLKIDLLASPKLEAAQMYVVYVPPALARAIGDPLTAIFQGKVTSSGRDGPWLRSRFHGTSGTEGVAWQRSAGGATWLLVGVAARQTFRVVEPLLADISSSWSAHPATAAAPRYTSTDRAIEGSALGWLAFALAAVALLAFFRRRPAIGRLVPALSFVAVAGLYYTLVELPTLGYTLFGASSRDAWPQLTLVGLEQLVAMVTLVALLTPAGRRLATELVALNLGLFAIYWLDRAISSGMNAGRLSVVAAVLVLLALLWEVVMSGEAITNRHDERFPRHARVLVYFGYIVGVATAVLFFSSISTAKGSVQPLFENENFSDTGLLLLGTALVVTLFILRAPSRALGARG